MLNNKEKKLVIAYSGGLDTSYCAVSLSKEFERTASRLYEMTIIQPS